MDFFKRISPYSYVYSTLSLVALVILCPAKAAEEAQKSFADLKYPDSEKILKQINEWKI